MLASAGKTACPVAFVITLGFEHTLRHRFAGFINKDCNAAASLFHTELRQERQEGRTRFFFFFLLESHKFFEMDILTTSFLELFYQIIHWVEDILILQNKLNESKFFHLS